MSLRYYPGGRNLAWTKRAICPVQKFLTLFSRRAHTTDGQCDCCNMPTTGENPLFVVSVDDQWRQDCKHHGRGGTDWYFDVTLHKDCLDGFVEPPKAQPGKSNVSTSNALGDLF